MNYLTKKDLEMIGKRNDLRGKHNAAYVDFMRTAFPHQTSAPYAAEWANRFKQSFEQIQGGFSGDIAKADNENTELIKQIYRKYKIR